MKFRYKSTTLALDLHSELNQQQHLVATNYVNTFCVSQLPYNWIPKFQRLQALIEIQPGITTHTWNSASNVSLFHQHHNHLWLVKHCTTNTHAHNAMGFGCYTSNQHRHFHRRRLNQIKSIDSPFLLVQCVCVYMCTEEAHEGRSNSPSIIITHKEWAKLEKSSLWTGVHHFLLLH